MKNEEWRMKNEDEEWRMKNEEWRMKNLGGVQNERFCNSGPWKNVKKHWLNKLLRMPISTIEKPYKTCRKWRLLGPFCEKGPENDQKSITIIVFSQRVFKTSRNSVTPLEFADFQNAKTRCENPYKTCRIWRLLEPEIENGLENHQKALPREGFRVTFSNSRKTL